MSNGSGNFDEKNNNGWEYFSQNRKNSNKNNSEKYLNESRFVAPPKKSGTGILILAGATLITVLMILDVIKELSTVSAGEHIRVLPVVIALIGIIAIVRIIYKLIYRKNYTLIYSYIYGKNCVVIRELAEIAGFSDEKMLRTLKQAIRYKSVPHGHISSDEKLLLVTDKEYEKYMGNPEKYESEHI